MEFIPPEVARYGPQLIGNATGKKGVLRLGLAHDPATKKTIIREQYSQVPLYAQKPMYLEKSLPAMAYMYMISQGGGILQGDSYTLDISLAAGAIAHMTTQGASRIYRMERGFATQQVDIAAGKDCYLEYMPDQIIPYAGSRFYQKTAIKAHTEATVVYSEVIAPGRVAMGESLQYDVCYLRVVATDEYGGSKFTDAAVLEPRKRDMKIRGVLGRDVVGAVYVLAPARFAGELYEEVNQAVKGLGGCSVLPRDSGIAVRMLGASASQVRSGAYSVAAVARKVILGTQFSAMRKG
jgi:urease accessory protein